MMQELITIAQQANTLLFEGARGVFVVLAVINTRQILQAFKGSDNRYSVEEVSKGVIIGILLYMVAKEAHRAHEWRLFSDWMYGVFIAGLLVMAKMEGLIKTLKAMFKK